MTEIPAVDGQRVGTVCMRPEGERSLWGLLSGGPEARRSVMICSQTSWPSPVLGWGQSMFPSQVCSDCPRLSLLPPFKHILQSAVLMVT